MRLDRILVTYFAGSVFGMCVHMYLCVYMYINICVCL